MKNMSKKLVALGLTAAMAVSTGLTAFAAASDPFWTTNPNLTNVNNTQYNYTITKGEAATKTLEVAAANASYEAAYIPENLLSDVTWSMLDGSDTSITFSKTSSKGIEVGGNYAAKTSFTVPTSAEAGLSVIQANSPKGYMDFTIVVNPASPSEAVNGVKVVAYSGSVDKANYITSNNNTTVKESTVDTDINYPSAMDAIAGVSSKYDIDTSWGSPMISSVTFANGKTYSNAGNTGWQYRVYGEDGFMAPISAVAGAEVFDVQEGDTVVWAFGAYGSVVFPEKFEASKYIPANQ